MRIPSAAFGDGGTHLKVTGYNVGPSPVGVAVRPDGKHVWVALSDRFGDDTYNPAARQLVGLAGLAASGAGPTTVLHVPASGFPRELSFLPDGRTLVVTLYKAKRVEFIRTPQN